MGVMFKTLYTEMKTHAYVTADVKWDSFTVIQAHSLKYSAVASGTLGPLDLVFYEI
jgi:hypothetical protein